ncbi:2-oxoglutaramate amidase [Stieleria bergensis]|uniref:2-oxoglutaramate amidase n=1 Tax=Stieleria bergensis TaxID=2528025 RepID=A0A517SZJ5_9BACT|nr:2-oxoglutaramate amidase [Planctomycetes bacterium SV_7m_r]
MEIVAVQLDMAWQDKSENHQRVENLLAGADVPTGALVILPEMFETGFCMDVTVTAQGPDRSGEQFLKDLAKQYNVAVMGGVAGPIIEGQSVNQAVVFDPDGNELARYQKMKPFSLSGEGDHYVAGTSHCLFTWQGVTIAPFICYDLRFPEIFRPAVAEGAELITLIACWPSKRSEHWVRLLQARAIENLACVVGVNRVGAEPGLAFDGRSSAFDHLGNPLFEADDQTQVLRATLDIEQARRWRGKFPALRDMKTPVE